MSSDTVTTLVSQALTVAIQVGGPLLLVGLVVGVVISIFQSVTQIQEQSLAFIPKIIGVGLVLVVLGPWMLQQLLSYTQNLWESIPTLIS
jgi:flagellar biosynthetic protein FliQ